MDLWLAPHDFRVRALRQLGYGYAPTPFGDCMALATDSHLLAFYFIEDKFEALAELQSRWPKTSLSRSANVDQLISAAVTKPEAIPVLAIGTPFQLLIWE